MGGGGELSGLEGALLSFRKLVNMINKENGEPHVFVVLSEKPDELRDFFARLASTLYGLCRERGLTGPPCLLVVDEADEFISREIKEPSYELSRAVAETIARRGRKLGLGLAIATQRVAYLDTKVMGQIHTYLVSKLPRASDRKTVAEAYGVPNSCIDWTLTLRTGEWLILSHSATSIRSKPILARFENANLRVKEKLEEFYVQ